MSIFFEVAAPDRAHFRAQVAQFAQIAPHLGKIELAIGGGLVDRELLVDLVAVAAVVGEHLLVIGPPGTAKSQAVRRVARALGGLTMAV